MINFRISGSGYTLFKIIRFLLNNNECRVNVLKSSELNRSIFNLRTPFELCPIRVYTISAPLKTWSKPFLKTKIQVMKKLNSLLHNVDVQGNLIMATIFAVIVVVSILTWGK